MTYKLYRKITRLGGRVFQIDYAWVDPAGTIFEHRVVSPLGNLPTRYVYEGETDIKGKTVKWLMQFDGWFRAKHTMTQEQLSNGWLL